MLRASALTKFAYLSQPFSQAAVPIALEILLPQAFSDKTPRSSPPQAPTPRDSVIWFAWFVIGIVCAFLVWLTA